MSGAGPETRGEQNPADLSSLTPDSCPLTPDLLVGLLIAAGTWLGYYQVLGHGFVNYDDPVYVSENLEISGLLSIDAIGWAFTTSTSGHWHPLTWISLAVDFQIFNVLGIEHAFGYHLVNVLLHWASAWMLYRLLRESMTIAPAADAAGSRCMCALVACLFAWHPLRVESVAWISERKDVLSVFFWMLTMLAYVRYVKAPGLRHYLWMAFFFVLGLLAKGTLVTLPVVLLLWDYWPLGRLYLFPSPPGTPGGEGQGEGRQSLCKGIAPSPQPSSPEYRGRGRRSLRPTPPEYRKCLSRRVAEKVPLLVLAVVVSFFAMRAMDRVQRPRADRVAPPLTAGERLERGVLAYGMYLQKIVWPTDLAPYYPVPRPPFAWRAVGLSALVLGGLTLAALVTARRWPFLVVGWLWFVITLLPVSSMVLELPAYLADRYTYIPQIGLNLAVVWGLLSPTGIFGGRAVAWRRACGGLIAAALLVCLVLTWRQVRIWSDSITLWRHTIEVTGGSFVAHTDLAFALKADGQLDEALEQFHKAAEIQPDYPRALLNLAREYRARKQWDRVVSIYERLIALHPENESYRDELTAIHEARQVENGKR